MTDIKHIKHCLGYLRGLQAAIRSCHEHGIEPGNPHWDNLRMAVKKEVTIILALLGEQDRPSVHRTNHHMWCNNYTKPLPCKMCDGMWIECPYEEGEDGSKVMARYFPANKLVREE